MEPHNTTVVDRHIAFIAKQRMHRNVWFAESSRAPALWRHDRNISNQNMAMLLPIFQGRLAMLTDENSALNRYVNVTKSMSI